jgi:exonuclease I
MARTPCLVPFCGRTTKEPYSEWICGKHWKLVPARMKSLLRRLRARLRRRSDPKLTTMENRTWQRCKRAVLERSAGL